MLKTIATTMALSVAATTGYADAFRIEAIDPDTNIKFHDERVEVVDFSEASSCLDFISEYLINLGVSIDDVLEAYVDKQGDVYSIDFKFQGTVVTATCLYEVSV